MEGSAKHYVDNTAQLSSAGMVIRQKEPKNLEAPFDRIDSYLTPTEVFFQYQAWTALQAGFEGGNLRPSPIQTWSLDQAIDAYASVERGATSSKQVLLPW